MVNALMPTGQCATGRLCRTSAVVDATTDKNTAPNNAPTPAVSPIAMQKTYTLPRAVTSMHHTITAHGISNKNILVGFRNGQVYSIDFKQIHPRRPFSEPSLAG